MKLKHLMIQTYYFGQFLSPKTGMWSLGTNECGSKSEARVAIENLARSYKTQVKTPVKTRVVKVTKTWEEVVEE